MSDGKKVFVDPIEIRDAKVPEDLSRLHVIDREAMANNPHMIPSALKQDCVVLLRNISPDQADVIMSDTASFFGLKDNLELQAGFAAFQGHRQNIGEYFMSVNNRSDYQFVTPHSEGSRFANMQLSSFFCYENTTDGGETILLNVDPLSSEWAILREGLSRISKRSRALTASEIQHARALFQIHSLDDAVHADDIVLGEYETPIPGFHVVEVLAKLQTSFSVILERELHVYWDNVGAIDMDAVGFYAGVLAKQSLLVEPPGGSSLRAKDSVFSRRRWCSGVNYNSLFKNKLTLKLAPGDLILQNNLTWPHSVSNWSPLSGSRKVAAAFA